MKNVFKIRLGTPYLWNVPDLCAPTAVNNKTEVESFVYPYELKTKKKIAFSKSNSKLQKYIIHTIY